MQEEIETLKKEIEQINIKLSKKTTIDQVYNYNNPNFTYLPTFLGVPLTGIKTFGSFYNLPDEDLVYEELAEIPLTNTYLTSNVVLEEGRIIIKESGTYYVNFTLNCIAENVNYLYLKVLGSQLDDKYSINIPSENNVCKFLSFIAYYNEDDVLLFSKTGSTSQDKVTLESNKGPQLTLTLMKIS